MFHVRSGVLQTLVVFLPSPNIRLYALKTLKPDASIIIRNNLGIPILKEIMKHHYENFYECFKILNKSPMLGFHIMNRFYSAIGNGPRGQSHFIKYFLYRIFILEPHSYYFLVLMSPPHSLFKPND